MKTFLSNPLRILSILMVIALGLSGYRIETLQQQLAREKQIHRAYWQVVLEYEDMLVAEHDRCAVREVR